MTIEEWKTSLWTQAKPIIPHIQEDEETGLFVFLSKKLRYALPESIRREAVAICGNIYRVFNANYAVGYAFNFKKGKSKEGITNGEYISKIDLPDLARRYSFVLIFSDNTFYSPLWGVNKNVIGWLPKEITREKPWVNNTD